MGDDPVSEPRRCLAVAVPCFNEAGTIAVLVDRVLESPWVAEVVVVDDGSTDGTAKVLADIDHPRVRVITHDVNRGKGASLRTAFAVVSAEYVIVQDADLEYDPTEYGLLLEPLERGVADVVFGSRFVTGRPHRVLYFWHSLGNRFLTLLSNMCTNLNLTDMETCYKMVRAPLLKSLVLTSDRFGFEPELTARLAQAGARVWEIPISYSGRTYAQGKKIGWRDGVRAAWCIVKYSPAVQRRLAPAYRRVRR